MPHKFLLSSDRPLPGDKAEALAARLAEYLGVEREDIFVLPEGVRVVPVEAAGHKPKAHAPVKESGK